MGNPARENVSSSPLHSPAAAISDQTVQEGAAAPQWSARQDSFLASSPHKVEHDVKRRLTAEPGCQFSSLVVRRINGGVCLEGVVEAGPCGDGIRSLVQQIAGVENVINHMVDYRR